MHWSWSMFGIAPVRAQKLETDCGHFSLFKENIFCHRSSQSSPWFCFTYLLFKPGKGGMKTLFILIKQHSCPLNLLDYSTPPKHNAYNTEQLLPLYPEPPLNRTPGAGIQEREQNARKSSWSDSLPKQSKPNTKSTLKLYCNRSVTHSGKGFGEKGHCKVPLQSLEVSITSLPDLYRHLLGSRRLQASEQGAAVCSELLSQPQEGHCEAQVNKKSQADLRPFAPEKQ